VAREAAYSDNGGKTWKVGSRCPAGYRWGVAIVPDTPGPTVFAVGPTGTDHSIDRGKNWQQMNQEHTDAIGFPDAHRGWAVGKERRHPEVRRNGFPAGAAPSLKK